jgi:hypothetical protein
MMVAKKDGIIYPVMEIRADEMDEIRKMNPRLRGIPRYFDDKFRIYPGCEDGVSVHAVPERPILHFVNERGLSNEVDS